MTGLADRFEAKVDRSGEHHIWTGSRLRDGSGKLKIGTRTVTARRVAWELVNGSLPPGVEVKACPDDKACVRLDHLSLRGEAAKVPTTQRGRAAPGSGSKREIRPGVWGLTVTRGRYGDGRPRREYRTVRVDTDAEAARELAAFVTEIDQEAATPPEGRDERDLTVNDAVDRYLEYLKNEKGREARTINGYRQVHEQRFAPEIGHRRLRDVDEATWDRLFGTMRQAGLSHSRMNNALSLYKPLYRWAKRRRIVRRNPLADFELPKSSHIPQPRRTPEVEQMCWLLSAAVDLVPDIAPLLTLSATTGMRRGEIPVRRRDQFNPRRGELLVDTAADVDGIKPTKTDRVRVVTLDAGTVDMLRRHIGQMDKRAALCGVEVASDAFLFSLEPDCSAPMPVDYFTKQLAKLKEYLGIANKRPETIALEDEALRLRRQPVDRPKGKPGPLPPGGGMSFDEIGRRLGRTQAWARKAVASAQRREATQLLADIELFDASLIGIRKFTSSELLDAGFNIAVVAGRQGHGTQVLAKHYAKARRSAERKAADHLGRLIHQQEPGKEIDAPSL